MAGIPTRRSRIEAVLVSLRRGQRQLTRDPRGAVESAVTQLLALGRTASPVVAEGEPARTYRIDDLARFTNTTVRNIRAYQERGLGAFVELARPDTSIVRGTGLDGQPVEFTGDGLLARCLQHETDHTLGTVFGDRLPTKLRKRLTRQMEAAADEHPASWPA